MDPKYTSLASLPHPVSQTHPPMSRANRAAQFAPFAALTGHEAAVAETARLTERCVQLDEDAREQLDRRWQYLLMHWDDRPTVEVTYFQKDKQKDGGAYPTVCGVIRKIDMLNGYMEMADGIRIPFADVVALEGTLFSDAVVGEELL